MEKFCQKPSKAAFSTVFRINFRSEVECDVISGADVEQFSWDVRVKFDESGSNLSRDIRLPHFVTNDNAGVRRSSHKATMKKSSAAFEWKRADILPQSLRTTFPPFFFAWYFLNKKTGKFKNDSAPFAAL